MVRYVFAVLLAAVSAVGATIGLIKPWQGGRHAGDFALRDLFTTGSMTPDPSFLGSVATPLLLGVVLAAVGVVLRLRTLTALGWVVCAVPTGLWALNAADDSFMIPDMQAGFTNAAMAVAALLLATLVLPRRAVADEPEADQVTD